MEKAVTIVEDKIRSILFKNLTKWNKAGETGLERKTERGVMTGRRSNRQGRII